MRPQRLSNRRPRSGFISLMAIQFLAIFAAIMVAFASVADREVQKSGNFREATTARLAAESGLTYATKTLKEVLVKATLDASASEVDMAQAIYEQLSAKLGSVSVDGNGIVYVPQISLGEELGGFNFTVEKIGATTFQLLVTGTKGAVARRLALNFEVTEDTSVLTYGVASCPRVIMRGNVQVDGDLYSSWTRVGEAPMLDINVGAGGVIDGDIKTVLSQEEFDEANCADYIITENPVDVTYDEPAVDRYDTDDFDTSSYAALATSTLPAPDYVQSEGFPDTNPSTWFNRNFYVGADANNQKLFDNMKITAGQNAHFKNVKFTGYTYIEIPNNIIFEDCTFEGPVITAVPSNYQWTTNALSYKGDTMVTNEIMPESTILAPNFNVNIGDFSKQGEESNSRITGVLVGGIVDIRDNAIIEGTILSMANLDFIGSPYYYGTNLGYWEEDYEEGGGEMPETTYIRVTPQPDNLLPYGIKKRYTLASKVDTYTELTATEP